MAQALACEGLCQCSEKSSEDLVCKLFATPQDAVPGAASPLAE